MQKGEEEPGANFQVPSFPGFPGANLVNDNVQVFQVQI